MNRQESNKGEYFAIYPWDYDKANYIFRMFYKILYFIIIVIFLTPALFSILIDNFNELRSIKASKEKDIRDICFICGASREEKEKESENFENHIKNVHDKFNYINYMIGLQFLNIQDTNAINSYVIECLKEKSIIWFPRPCDVI